MKLKTLKELAIKEAENLKSNLTETEKKKLSKFNFDPESSKSCIYGMATGDCNSDRAIELIKKCCERVYVDDNRSSDITKRRLNGDPKNINAPYKRSVLYTSPIETIIFPQVLGKEAGEKIIDFLKDETKTLIL